METPDVSPEPAPSEKLPASGAGKMGAAAKAVKYAIPGALVLTVLVVAVVYRTELGIAKSPRVLLVAALAALILYGANRAIIRTSSGNEDVRYVIAYNCVIFIVVGLAGAILSCTEWTVALLLCGSSMLTGGFFGLLFGYPQGVAQQSGAQANNLPNQSGGSQPASKKNLVAESAETLGKVIAGFTLAKAGRVTADFASLCHTVSPALGVQDATVAYVLAGVTIVYFFAVGFFSGLLLPAYFMSDQF